MFTGRKSSFFDDCSCAVILGVSTPLIRIFVIIHLNLKKIVPGCRCPGIGKRKTNHAVDLIIKEILKDKISELLIHVHFQNNGHDLYG